MIRNKKKLKGTITVELAVAGPLLVMMMVGAADFSRVFYHAVTIAGASGVGSFWGSQNLVKSVSFGRIEDVAEDDARNLDAASADAELYCDCPTGTKGGTLVECDVLSCDNGYGAPRVYSKTTVQQTFELMLPWPGVPSPIVVNRETFTRVQ